MAGLKILICGGGIAGNALAFWLSKNNNHDVTVVERYPDLRVNGLQVDLRGPGIQVLKRMGLDQEFRAHAAREQGLQVVSSSGSEWAYFPANKSGTGAQSFTSDYEIMRGNLTQILHDASKAKYRFGTSIERYQDKGDAVEVVFSDGTTEQFDLLIGADGQWSRTRKMMLEPGEPDQMNFLSHNLYIGYYTMPRLKDEGQHNHATAYLATDNRLIMTRGSNPTKIQVYLQLMKTAVTERLRKAHRSGVEGEKAALAEIFRGAGWRTEELLKGLEESDDFYMERLAVVKMDSWSRGRVVVVGDAAHCPSAMTGMGTTSAIVGTYILAGEIEKHCRGPRARDGVPVALKEYDQKLRPLMTRIQKGVSEGPKILNLYPSSWYGIAIFYVIVKLVVILRLHTVVGWFSGEETLNDWKLPEYEGLRGKAQ